MNKLPTKQIYLLLIIVLGIITLSVYSTYAIFTLESETSDIINLEIANVLNIETNTYEYKQIIINPSSSSSTDIDIYNNYDYEICYSIWYKVVTSKDINSNNISIYQNTTESLSTSGALPPVSSKRINLIIKNNNDKPVKVNIGISYSKNEGTCELNISDDKKLITSTKDETKILSDIIIKDTEIKNSKSDYIIYTDNTKEIILSNDKKIYVSNKYSYKDEIFTLTDSKEIDVSKISNNEINYYTCLYDTKCRYLYQIKDISKENNTYKITKYDTLIGYLSGNSGVRRVNNNYYYYGDNPNNYLYFNCTNNIDTSTCELWRIIGTINNNGKYITKIIKNDSIGLSEYSQSDNNWKNSIVLSKLKEYIITNENILEEVDYKIENITNLNTSVNEIPLLNETYKSNIRIMNLSDYLNTSICTNKKINEYDDECLNNNWLNKNYSIDEWTMTIKHEESYIDDTTNETITPNNNTIYSFGTNIKESLSTSNLHIRPVLYLKDTTVLLDGNGTFEKPYIVG